jgi:hypothetical protein
MHRAFPESTEVRRVLQTIWHQVSTAGEVFAVGAINPAGAGTRSLSDDGRAAIRGLFERSFGAQRS